MTDRIPLIVNAGASQIQELAVGDNISIIGNIAAGYFVGNGSQLTGISSSGNYANSNVAAFLPTYTGAITANSLVTTGNISGNYILGNGSQLTGLPTGSNYSNANVIAYTESGFAGNIFPAADNTYSLGSQTSQWKELWVSSSTIYVGNIPLGTANGQLYFNNAPVVSSAPDGNISATGNVTATSISVIGNVTGNYILGNGSLLTGLPAPYTNANVNAYLPTYTGNLSAKNITANTVTTSGNVTGNYILGNGSQLTGITTNTANITFTANTISTNILNGNINLAGNGTGKVSISSIAGGATGIQLGTPTLGNLISNAITLTSNTSVTNSIAELNAILGKLIPPSPPKFPNGQTIAITGLSTYRMSAGFTQTDNTSTGGKAVSAGSSVATVLRTNGYSTTTVTNTGPGDSGKLTAYLNGADAGNTNFNASASPSANGTHGNLIVFNNSDYNTVNSIIASGFWYVFSASAAGSANPGWNEVYLSDTAGGNTNAASWYYDNSTPGTPQFSNVSIVPQPNPTYTYSSTIPHYVNTNNFILTANINKLSGDTYPTSDAFLTGQAGGALSTPVSLTYTSAGVTTPLQKNLYVSSGNLSISTTSSVISGYGSSSDGVALSADNSYSVGTASFTPAGTVLYKTGNTTAIDEANISVDAGLGAGSANGFRIVNPGTGDNPVFSGSESAFNSQVGPLLPYDAIVVGSGSQGILTFSQTNYSTGYLPPGPNLSTQQNKQYFTFKFVRSSVSKFDINITGSVGGVWVALPGSVIDSTHGGVGATSSIHGWLDMSLAYSGSGIPGANASAGGNGSNGCALGSVVPLNTSVDGGFTCTFGTVSSSSTAANEIYVRILLTSGQSLTALSIQTASN